MPLFRLEKRIRVLGLDVRDIRFQPVYFLAEQSEYHRLIPKGGTYLVKTVSQIRLMDIPAHIEKHDGR